MSHSESRRDNTRDSRRTSPATRPVPTPSSVDVLPIHNARTDDPRLMFAAFLVAATGASRNPQSDIRNPSGYIVGSANAVLRSHGETWRAVIASQPNATAEDLAYAVHTPYGASVPAPSNVRVVNGVEHRFMPGSGWCPPLPLSEYERLAQ